MKKCLLVALVLGFLAGSVLANTINVSGRAGMFNPGSGVSSSMMYGVAAEYTLVPNVSLRGAVDTTTYNDALGSVTYMPATVDLIFSQTFAGVVTPYAGAGLGYHSVTRGGSTSSTTGYQAEIGGRMSVGGLTAGIEYRYIVPDATKSTSTSNSTAYVQGGFSQSFNI